MARFIGNHLMDVVLILGIVFISIGAFLTSVVIGFYATGAMLVLFAFLLFRFGGD